jgi:hypothetical protein
MSQPIIVVSGLPRTGTSMMMRVLASGGVPVVTDDLRTADDDNPHGYYELEDAKRVRDDDSFLDQAGCKAVKMIYRLLYDLPDRHEYRVVFMQRDLREVVASQNRMLERRGEPVGQIPDEKVVKLFERDLQAINAWLAARPHIQVLRVDYNQVLKGDPRPQFEALSAFLGGGLDLDAMLQVVDASLYRNRR